MAPSARGGQVVDSVLDASGPVLDVLETALELVPVPGLGLIPKALSVIVEDVKTARANDEARKAFLDKTALLGAALRKADDDARIRIGQCGRGQDEGKKAMDKIVQSGELEKGVKVLHQTIDELKERAADLKRKPGVRGLVKGVLRSSRDAAILSEMEGKLSTAIEAFQVQSQLAINKGIHEIQTLLMQAEERAILAQLAYADAGYRGVDALKSGFMDGTRTDLVEDLRSWSEGRFPPDDPKQIFLLTGYAGTGKSAVAHRLCRHLAGGEFTLESCTSLLGASFFFVRGTGNTASALFLVPTVARQLAECHPALRACVVAAARTYTPQGHLQQVRYAFEGLLKSFAADMHFERPNTRIFLVLDGLDECTEQNLLSEALEHLFSLVRDLPWLYIFAASRPEPNIIHTFASPEAAALVHRHELADPSESSGDVALYLRDTIPRIPGYAALVERTPSLLSRLIERAAGLFIFARITVNFLDTQRDNAEEALEAVASWQGQSLSSLDALYLQIMRSAFPPDQLRVLPRQHARLLSLLTIVIHGRHAMFPGAIALLGENMCQTFLQNGALDRSSLKAATTFSEADVIAIVSRLRSVLLVNSNGVQPFHDTFAQFISHRDSCPDVLYYVDYHEGHAALASACLSAFTLNAAVEMILGYRRRDHAVWDYVFYVIHFLPTHIGEATYTQKLQDHLETFIQGARLPIMVKVLRMLRLKEPVEGMKDLVHGMMTQLVYSRRSRIIADSSTELTLADLQALVPDNSPLIDKCIQLFAYSDLFFDRDCDPTSADLPDITAEDVRSYLVKNAYDEEMLHEEGAVSYVDAMIRENVESWDGEYIEVLRYRAVMQTLIQDVRQDKRTQDLWYDLSPISTVPSS
ncbi:AAA-16 domain-containing protein [Phanerochaete sordida]|uniref:AAA-16 domain-containing protein n=1 Tax=Phanerochaete sordida TaxID=48140 RepID=A0A9P3GEN2_9APHY|nr:AAA-16 domain-containing protein [Phanerochaete sordida]